MRSFAEVDGMPKDVWMHLRLCHLYFSVRLDWSLLSKIVSAAQRYERDAVWRCAGLRLASLRNQLMSCCFSSIREPDSEKLSRDSSAYVKIQSARDCIGRNPRDRGRTATMAEAYVDGEGILIALSCHYGMTRDLDCYLDETRIPQFQKRIRQFRRSHERVDGGSDSKMVRGVYED